VSGPPQPTGLPTALPQQTIASGSVFYRIHSRVHDPLSFGKWPAGTLRNRFDDPEGTYGVCYFGHSPQAAFAESFLRRQPARVVSFSHLGTHGIARVVAIRALAVVPLFGSALPKLGATAEVSATRDYTLSQAWSRALWMHPATVDGIVYRSRHDDDQGCLALFDRASDAIAVEQDVPLVADRDALARILDRYDLGLDV
jgi:hypothetical protein